MIHEIRSDVRAIQENKALYQEANFADRAEALDLIEFHVIDRIEGMLCAGSQTEELVALKQHAVQIRDQLEEINQKLFQEFRAHIRSGNCTAADLKRQFDERVERASRERSQDDIGYDSLDMFVNGLLRIDVAPQETRKREPEMVFYQPTPARVILELVERANIGVDDTFYDLGSGLGQVPILVNLLTGAKARGIEFEPAYCEYARQCARRLNLSRVEFINLDAREADYSDGTIFFMYTPFEGTLLQKVLGKLESESRRRMITIATYGPCTRQVSDQNWLKRLDRDAHQEFRLGVFQVHDV